MEYSEKFISFLENNVTSYEFQFFTVNNIAKSIIDFNLYLNGRTDTINYGHLLTTLYLPRELFKNQKFAYWAFIKLGPIELNLSEIQFNKILNKENEILKILRTYFDISTRKNITVSNTVNSITLNPYSKTELETCLPLHLNLHDFQARVKDRMSNLLIGNDTKRILVQMPTGSGKTRTAIEFLIDHIRISSPSLNQHNIYLWFTNTVELSEQAFTTFVDLWRFRGDREVGVHKLYGNSNTETLYNNIKEENISILFIGFQKFNSLFNSQSFADAKLLQLIREDNVIAIVDEAHISLAKTYDSAIEYVMEFNRAKLIGLTATPGRNSFIIGGGGNFELAQKFHSNLIEISFKDTNDRAPLEVLQDRGYLAHIEFVEIENLSWLAANSPIENLAFDLDRNKKILQQISDRYYNDKSILVFSASTEHSIILKTCLKSLNIESEIIDSNSENQYRSKYISDFKNGKLKVLINFGVLSTGFDAPILNCLIIARPISSLVLFSQIMGRALRGPKNGGNTKNEVIVIKDKMMKYPNVDFLYSYWNSFWD